MAFTMSVLAWGALENGEGFESAGELVHVREAIQWGTDYLLKASSAEPMDHVLWVQVGDAEADHQCWQRPETMTTPRTAYRVNASQPGTEVAAETAAALAAASLVFHPLDFAYSSLLLHRATLLFDFALTYQASNTGECPFYCSYSGYEDELLWAAAWLLKASGGSDTYLQYIQQALPAIAKKFEFSWDDKSAGASVLLANHRFSSEGDGTLNDVAKAKADYFMCSNLPGNALTRVHKTPGGILYLGPWANSQYAGGAAFLAAVYSDYLVQANQSSISCDGTLYSPQHILNLAQSQVDYILGDNPLNMSYMVGFGEQWPRQVHHRGASIPTWYNPTEEVGCGEGYELWFWRDAPNANEIVGAIVGGPDQYDAFQDLRSNAAQLEPATYINAVFTPLFARFHLAQQQRHH